MPNECQDLSYDSQIITRVEHPLTRSQLAHNIIPDFRADPQSEYPLTLEKKIFTFSLKKTGRVAQ